MLKFTIRRIFSLIPILIGVSLISFIILQMAPGDPALTLAGEDATLEDVMDIRKELGLDKPVSVQYLYWLSRVVRGDLGTSFRTKRPVLQEILTRFPATLELAFASVIVSTILGLFFGIFAAKNHNSMFDYGTMVVSMGGVSIPNFWQGLMLMLLFAVTLGWLPAVGRGDWRNLILPAITMGTSSAAIIARMTRSSLLEVTRQDYIRTARAKGLSENTVIFKHAVRNAMIPVVTLIGMQMGGQLAGSVFTETIFAWPGIGRLMVNAIYMRDYPVVQGTIMFIAFNFALINLCVDLLYGLINPRLRVS